MAKRRMFSVEIIESDAFCTLTPSAQMLYMHLCLNADDEGFVDKWKSILRYLRVKQQSLDTLIDLGYVLMFDEEVLLIADWTRHNTIRLDRFSPSPHRHILSTLKKHTNGRYIKASERFLATQYNRT
jgi:hypothetical protein